MINTETNYRWFIFYQDQLLLEKNDNAFSIPTGKNAPVTTSEGITVHTITTATGMVCKAFYTDSPIAETPEYVQIGLRASYDYLSPEHYQAAGKVHEILYWDRSNRFCPTCGTPLVQKEPIMKKCPNCGREIYPVISTAILVLVRKEDSLLLVHARNFKGTFIRYFGSQPWPYPSGLMVGFIADYAGGDIHLQDDELSSGNFYTRDHLPELPRKLSLARKMIDWWIAQQ